MIVYQIIVYVAYTCVAYEFWGRGICYELNSYALLHVKYVKCNIELTFPYIYKHIRVNEFKMLSNSHSQQNTINQLVKFKFSIEKEYKSSHI